MFKEASRIFFVGLLAVQVSYTYCDLFDDATTQLENLREIVRGAIVVATNNLEGQYLEFNAYGDNTISEGELEMREAQDVVDGQLESMKNAAQTVGVSITSCLRGREDYLVALPGVLLQKMTACIQDKQVDAFYLLGSSEYLIDSIYNRVNDLEFQIGLCSSESCLSPIIDLIALEMVQLPAKVDLELTRATDLFELLIISVDDCSRASVSEYIGNSNVIVKDLFDCVNSVIG